MLHKQLQRVNQLDKQIADMHLRLSEYYNERAALTSGKIVPTASTTDTTELYAQLQATWQSTGVKLPTYKTLSGRLTKAAAIIDTMLANNPQQAGKLHVVAVPPQAQLDKLLAGSERYVFTEDYQTHSTKRSTGWSLVVVTSPDFSLAIDTVSESLGKDELKFKQYDYRGLGIREAIAADLQGLEIVTGSNWTLLLRDAPSADYIPCVTKQDDQLIFEVDDARCLLGNNYVQPAILVK